VDFETYGITFSHIKKKIANVNELDVALDIYIYLFIMVNINYANL
jgi:hypothetical protein